VSSSADSPRAYDSSRRRAVAQANRHAILEACRELLLRDGYQATTIRAVADRANLSPETVYKAFGSKPQMMKALWDITLAGDDDPVTMAERPELRTVLSTTDPRLKLRLYAAFVTGVHERLATLFTLLTGADQEVAQLLATTEQERLTGVSRFVAHLADEGILRAGADQSATADSCWALTSPHLFIQLTAVRQWSVGAYRQWLTDMLTAALL
jgi:AcrR family transcriptional regulator